MSGDNDEIVFWDRANVLIDLAKKQLISSDEGNTRASFLYASAKFNAFISAFAAKNKEELVEKKK